MEWRTKRKIIFALVALIILAIIIAIPTFVFLNTRKVSCFDKVQNGDETGVDCGGTCSMVCLNTVKKLVTKTAESFRVSESVYNSVAIIENPNIDAGAFDVEYKMSVIDNVGKEIDSKTGKIDIPANKTFAIFAGGMRIPTSITDFSTTITFTSIPLWTKEYPSVPKVSVRTNPVIDENTRPRIEGTVNNVGSEKTDSFRVVALISDEEGNPIGVSSTQVNPLSKDASTPIFFAWPEPFVVGSRLCESNNDKKIYSTLGDVALVIDRSGSMDDEKINPPEPLNTVRDAASHFAESMSGSDRGSLISFANDATVDSGLTQKYSELADSINSVKILKDVIQNTNLADGISKAFDVLKSSVTGNKRKAMVVLTDGIATRPLKEDDADYPEHYASEIADTAKKSGIEIYVIGLGKSVHKEFLESIATQKEYYYGADKKEELEFIYDSIATSICNNRPAIVQTYIVKEK